MKGGGQLLANQNIENKIGEYGAFVGKEHFSDRNPLSRFSLSPCFLVERVKNMSSHKIKGATTKID